MEELGKWEELVNLMESLKVDAAKVYVKKNKQAGIRLRKGLMSMRKLAKEVKDETISLSK